MLREVTLRPEKESDIPLLAQLYASTREEEMKLVPWTAEQKAAFLQMQFECQYKHYHEYYRSASFEIIECDGSPAGRLCVDRSKEEFRVVDIVLLPEFRNRGVATQLLGDIIEQAEDAGAKVSMHVLRGSQAMRLYERLGFELAKDKGVYLLIERAPAAQKHGVAAVEVH